MPEDVAFPRGSLRRSMRGYDRDQTDRLLADVEQRYARLVADCAGLAADADRLRAEMRARDESGRTELQKLIDRLAERDARLTELEQQIAPLEVERKRLLDEAERLRSELSALRRWKGMHDEEVAVLRQQARRLETRDRALTGQIAMLEARLEEAAAAGNAPESAPDRRAWSVLVTADRMIERLVEDARQEAELTLKKARRRADALVRTAMFERERVRADLEQLTASERRRIRADLDRLTALEAELNEGVHRASPIAPEERDLVRDLHDEARLEEGNEAEGLA